MQLYLRNTYLNHTTCGTDTSYFVCVTLLARYGSSCTYQLKYYVVWPLCTLLCLRNLDDYKHFHDALQIVLIKHTEQKPHQRDQLTLHSPTTEFN